MRKLVTTSTKSFKQEDIGTLITRKPVRRRARGTKNISSREQKKNQTHTHGRGIASSKERAVKKSESFLFCKKKTKNSSSSNEGKRTTTTKETEETPCLERDKKDVYTHSVCVCVSYSRSLGPKNPEGKINTSTADSQCCHFYVISLPLYFIFYPLSYPLSINLHLYQTTTRSRTSNQFTFQN